MAITKENGEVITVNEFGDTGMETVHLTLMERYVAAWAEMRNPPLDKTNPHFRNRFASLAATLGAIRPACAKHGIAYMQLLGEIGGDLYLTSMVTDGKREHELSCFPIHRCEVPQQLGSALTYAKRQQAQADWAIVGEDDDDAEDASNIDTSGPKPWDSND